MTPLEHEKLAWTSQSLSEQIKIRGGITPQLAGGQTGSCTMPKFVVFPVGYVPGHRDSGPRSTSDLDRRKNVEVAIPGSDQSRRNLSTITRSHNLVGISVLGASVAESSKWSLSRVQAIYSMFHAGCLIEEAVGRNRRSRIRTEHKAGGESGGKTAVAAPWKKQEPYSEQAQVEKTGWPSAI